MSRSILCRNDAERARVVDMSRRLHPTSGKAIGVILVAAILGIPSFGWQPLVPMLLAAGAFFVLHARLDRHRRPERVLAVSWLLAQLMVVAVILVSPGPPEMLFPLFAFPMMLAAVVWPTRCVVAGAVLSSIALVAVAFITDAAQVLATPPVLTHQIALLISTALVASISRDAEVDSRSSAVVDQLTGTLNRAALLARGRELEHQAASRARTVTVLVADVDDFKRVNDERGHSAGDAILREVAYRLRKMLPPFAGVYRYGGEEFVVLLPDVDAAEALTAAERLREVVAEAPIDGTSVTISVGAAASSPGEPFDFEHVLALADHAMYAAKDAGRNTVRPAEPAEDVHRLPHWSGAERRRSGQAPMVPAPAAPAAPGRDAADDASWLVDPLERQHLLDLADRLRDANHVPYGVAFLAMILLGPWYGWWPLVPVVIASVVYRAAARRLHRFRRPEYVLGGAWLMAQVLNTVAYAVAVAPPNGSKLFALPLLLMMVVGSSAVFPPRGVLVGTGFTAALIIGLAFYVDRPTVMAEPSQLVVVLALLAAIGLIGRAVGRSTVQHRSAAVVDALTGLLNRRALEARSVELAHQAAATGAPVALVLADLDHFKSINDSAGHATGDRTLEEVAHRLRRHVHALEAVYRFGGEEFAILLPGASERDAVATAERLRRAVSTEPIHGRDVTMSIGVAATRPGESFDFDKLFAAADRALYTAKTTGRDRVCAAGPADADPELLAA